MRKSAYLDLIPYDPIDSDKFNLQAVRRGCNPLGT